MPTVWTKLPSKGHQVKSVEVESMKGKRRLGSRIRGWLPKTPNSPNHQAANVANTNKKRKLTIAVGASALVISAFLLFVVIMALANPIYPTDARIIDTLNENKNTLLNIPGVIGAGIARNSTNNHIIGIAVYVGDNATDTAQVPQTLGGFAVFIQRVDEATDYGNNMIIRREGT
jgi:hypothetical protein